MSATERLDPKSLQVLVYGVSSDGTVSTLGSATVERGLWVAPLVRQVLGPLVGVLRHVAGSVLRLFVNDVHTCDPVDMTGRCTQPIDVPTTQAVVPGSYRKFFNSNRGDLHV